MSNDPDLVPRVQIPRVIFWLQGITFAWMSIETAVSLYSAQQAHSAALLAFGSDSLIELLSASVVLLSFMPTFSLNKDRAERWAGILLFVLAGLVACTAIASLIYRVQPETSRLGIGITIAALIVMPLLAWGKRKAAHATNIAALWLRMPSNPQRAPISRRLRWLPWRSMPLSTSIG